MTEMKTPKSQLEWQKNYDSKNMSTIAMKMPILERENIEQAASKSNLKLATFCRACIKYCIDNNIDLKNIKNKD